MTCFKNKIFTLFIVLSIHITLLDLVVATYNNVIFLVNRNIELKTIITHFLIVVISVSFYILLNTLNNGYQRLLAKPRDYMWIIWSVILVLFIGFILT